MSCSRCLRRSRPLRTRTKPWFITCSLLRPPRLCAPSPQTPDTWGQNLIHHPHLHCVVPGGGLSADGQRWLACRSGFFLPVRVLSRFFRRRFLELLAQAFDRGELEFFSALLELRERHAFRRYLDPLREKEWVVYAKAPFAGPEQVLDYVGRYTHRVAISNNRLLDIDDGTVTFRWKDYRDDNAQKTMTLAADEFIRRFLLHAAITVCLVTGTERRSSHNAASFYRWNRRHPETPTPSHPTIEIGTKNSPASPCINAPFVTAVACSLSSRSAGRRRHQSPSTHHDVRLPRSLNPAKTRIVVFRCPGLPDTAHSASYQLHHPNPPDPKRTTSRQWTPPICPGHPSTRQSDRRRRPSSPNKTP
jgi:Putative transposase